MPKAGGIDDQDSYTMDMLMLLDRIFSHHEDLKEKEFRINLVKASKGVV